MKCKTQHKTKGKAWELSSVVLSGSESARQRSFGLLKASDVEQTQSLIKESASKGKYEFRRRFRDDVKDTRFRIVVDVNNMSAHGVQDDGEGYNKVLV